MRPIFTQLLRTATSHVVQHMKTAYPDTLALRKSVRDAAGDILVWPGDADPGTVGTAFDILSGFLLIDGHVPLDPAPSHGWRPVHSLIADRLTDYVYDALPDHDDGDEFYQMVWVLAELTSIARTGRTHPDGPLETVIRASTGLEGLLGIAPSDGIRQLRHLEKVATEQLYPHVHQPMVASVALAGSGLVQAEADLIADGLLLDYKTAAGTPHKVTGVRAFFPPAIDIYQVLGYMLMDVDDEYGIEALGLYGARYGSLSVWEVPELLGITSGGHAVSLDKARSQFRTALEADYAAFNATFS